MNESISNTEEALAQFNELAPEPAQPAAGNTVAGVPEPQFRMFWISMLSRAMLKTGRGFRVDTPKRRPPKGAARWRGERRANKVGTSKLSRALMAGAV